MKRLDKGGVKGLNVDTKEKDFNSIIDLNESFDAFNIENKINVDKETESMLRSLFINYKEIV